MVKKKVKSRKRNTEIHDRKPLSERAYYAMIEEYNKKFLTPITKYDIL